MAAAPTIDAVWARVVTAHLKKKGLPVDEVLDEAGINPRTLNQKNARILFRKHARLLDLAAEATDDNCLGLHLSAQDVDIRDVGLLAYVEISSKTLGEAIRNLARYAYVLNEAALINLTLSGEIAVLGFELTDPTVRTHRQAIEFAAGNLVRTFRFITKSELHPADVTFA